MRHASIAMSPDTIRFKEVSRWLVVYQWNVNWKLDLSENKNTLTGPVNCKKITRHHAHLSFCTESRKTNNASRENGQKPQFGQFFDDFGIKYLQIVNFSEKHVSFKLKVYLVLTSGQNPKKSLEPLKCLILGCFGDLFANISKSRIFLKNPALSLSYLYSP